MGKRSNFERVERDYYPTPYEAVVPLFPFIPPKTKFIEPCAGDGRLIRHLKLKGHDCLYACDIEPKADGIVQRDVLFFDEPLPWCEMIITNPPWEREVLHAMIAKFVIHAPTWLLFDADWIHTVQAAPFAKICSDVVSVGRVQWIEGSKTSGMENACWYLFDRNTVFTRFHFRT